MSSQKDASNPPPPLTSLSSFYISPFIPTTKERYALMLGDIWQRQLRPRVGGGGQGDRVEGEGELSSPSLSMHLPAYSIFNLRGVFFLPLLRGLHQCCYHHYFCNDIAKMISLGFSLMLLMLMLLSLLLVITVAENKG